MKSEFEFYNEKRKQIKIYVTEAELNQIKKNAKVCDQTVSAYVRESALNMCVVPIDLTIIREHTEQISAYQNVVNHLIYTIKRIGDYVPADLEFIFEKTSEILRIEKSLLEQYTRHVDTTEKTVSQTVRRAINERLKKNKKAAKKICE